MNKSATLNIRVNPAVKERAERVLSRLGISMSTAIDMYLNQISLTGGIPFDGELPKAPENINADLVFDERLKSKIQKGYDEAKAGKVQDVQSHLKISGRSINEKI